MKPAGRQGKAAVFPPTTVGMEVTVLVVEEVVHVVMVVPVAKLCHKL